MTNSLLLGGVLELLGGIDGTYNVLDETGSFGDPQAVTQEINAQLTQGSLETGDFTDNRSATFQILIQAPNVIELALAESALRSMVNQSKPNVLRWAPDGGYPVYYDIFRGQPAESPMSWAVTSNNVKIMTISMKALPFARSTDQRMITGAATSVQLADFASATEYAYYTPSDQSSYFGEVGVTGVPFATPGPNFGPQTNPSPIDGTACMRADADFWRQGFAEADLAVMVGPVTGLWDLSDCPAITFGFSTDNGFQKSAYIQLTDSFGAAQTFTVYSTNGASGWQYVGFSLVGATVDLTSIVSWKLWLNQYQGNDFNGTTFYLGSLRAFPGLGSLASTTNGAMFKLAGILGDAQAPASIEFDRIVSGNLLPAADASFETGVGSWIGINATVSQSAAVALDGLSSLQLSATTAGSIGAAPAQIPVQPLTEYTVSASVRAAATPAPASVTIQWHDASNAGISAVSGTTGTDSTGAWTLLSATGIAPATAAYAIITVGFLTAASSELHYVDAVMFCEGTSTLFAPGTPWPTIQGFLVLRSPAWASIDTPTLVDVVSGVATTVAPSPLSGTYKMVAVDVAPIAGGAPMVVTQLNNGIPVPGGQVTLQATVVAGGTRWGDFGDLTFPLVDIPAQASNTTYTFQVTGTDVILCDTRGFLVWVPTMTPANYVWIDEATAFGMGGVYAGSMPDRSDAVSLLGAEGVQPSGAMSVDGGVDNYLLVYTLDGVPVHVSISYFDRYLGQRTAA